MTTARRDGGGSKLGRWYRENKNLDSKGVGLSIIDIDFCIHRFMTPIDGIGTRALQCTFDMEVKTFGKEVPDYQRDTLWQRHQRQYDKREHVITIRGRKVGVWDFGVAFLRFSGEDIPANGNMQWGVFDSAGRITWSPLDWIKDLEEISCFLRDPQDPKKRVSFRRHHKTRELVISELQPLGFYAERIVKRRS
jgi:hypothetical protein